MHMLKRCFNEISMLSQFTFYSRKLHSYLLVWRSHTRTAQSTELLNRVSWLEEGWKQRRVTMPLDPCRLCVQYCFTQSHTLMAPSLEPTYVLCVCVGVHVCV